MRPVVINDQFLMTIRQALLSTVDAIEILLGMKRTSEIRKEHAELIGKK